MILRLLGPQGLAGLAVSLCLTLLLVWQKGETRHWRKQSGQYEQLYRHGEAALAATALLLATVAGLAALVPARAATSVDPSSTLRHD